MSLKRREQGPPGARGGSRRGRRRRGRETDETATGRGRATGTQAQRRLGQASDAQTKTEPGLQRQGLAVHTMNRNLRRGKLVGVDEQGPGVGHGGCRDWGGTGVVPLYLRRSKLVGVDEQGPGVGHGGCGDWRGTGVVPLYLRRSKLVGVDEQGPGVGHGRCRDWGSTGMVPLYLGGWVHRPETVARAGATSQRLEPPHAMWAGTAGTGTVARAGATSHRPEPQMLCVG